jgi:nitrous oxidase accessory protein NosD/nitrous oxide reductase accessory protein NosL
MRLGRALPAALALLLLVGSASFAVPAQPTADLSPVPFEDTVAVGMTAASLQLSASENLTTPKVEVYYSGYQYVVGYYGLDAYVDAVTSPEHTRRYGRPVATFVTDYAGTNVHLTDEGYLAIDPTRVAGFVPAGETYVVVGSEARTPSGPVAVPFSDRDEAEAFAGEHGGSVVPWAELPGRLTPSLSTDRDAFERAITERSRWADGAASEARTLRDRPVSVVVGEDAPTLTAAVERAPPNTTVRLPPGTYEGNVTLDKPLTVTGAGNATRVVGDGTGTVLRVAAPRVALTDLNVSGVGPNGTATELSGNVANWTQRVELAYGRGDAGVEVGGAPGTLLANLTVTTPSNGFIVRRSPGAVLENVTVRGSPEPLEGYMGVVAMYDRVVVQRSTFVDGRDGVYTHRADGSVIRHNHMESGRFGVHEMYTSNLLVRENHARDETIGIVLMTRPAGNVVVDNDVRDSEIGLATSGTASYYARNVLADNARGLSIGGSRSLVVHNTVVGNEVGLRGATILPTNSVYANDVVDNERTVRVGTGPVRVWSAGGEGNYWGPLPFRDRDGDGHYDRSFRPSSPVGERAQVPGAPTLARSPALDTLRAVQGTVPGLRESAVVDDAPRTRPARPVVLSRVRANVTDADDGEALATEVAA